MMRRDENARADVPVPASRDGLLIALWAVSLVCYALCSDAVRTCIAEVTRLMEKF